MRLISEHAEVAKEQIKIAQPVNAFYKHKGVQELFQQCAYARLRLFLEQRIAERFKVSVERNQLNYQQTVYSVNTPNLAVIQ
jgi:hypothetical protein